MPPRPLLLATLLGACSSCSSSNKPPSPAPTPAKREPQIRALDLGHYRSADGTVGLVLDRKEKSARVKLDGTTEVIVLDGIRSGDCTDYVKTINSRMLEVCNDGRVVVYLPQRPAGLELVRDGDVDLVSGEVTIKPPPDQCCDKQAKVTKDQPPEIKLKLGHWKNDKRGIGLVFDATTKPAKVKFDGTAEVIQLDVVTSNGRLDYIKSLHHTVVSQWPDGRTEVWVPGATDSIAVKRDGDADPL